MSESVTSVHRFFMGAGEFVKLLYRVALLMDLIVTTLAINGLTGDPTLERDWRPLLLLLLALLGMLFRIYAVHLDNFAHLCRRTALRAYALGKEVESSLLSEIESRSFSVLERWSKRLPAKSLDEYYRPTCPQGLDRLRELYAHSAFYNWRLQHTHAWIAGAFGALLLIVALVVTYVLVVLPLQAGQRAVLLEGFYSVALILFALRALYRRFLAAASAIAMERLARAFITPPLPTGDALNELVLNYEVERARMPPIPTLLYRWLREQLARQWEKRRAALGCTAQAPVSAINAAPAPATHPTPG